MSSLIEKLQLQGGGVVSLVGAGGKTTLMFCLARELAGAGETVLTTTTTKILMPSKEQSAHVVVSDDPATLIKRVGDLAHESRHITAASGRLSSQGKLIGFDPEVIQQLWKTDLFRWILVEADGAAGRPLKAPASHEPVIPQNSGWVIAVVGLDVIGKALDDRWVFRPQLYSEITGLPLGARITVDSIAAIISHDEGLMKGCPSQARRFVFLNKAEDDRRRNGGQRIRAILEKKGGFEREILLMGVLKPEPFLA